MAGIAPVYRGAVKLNFTVWQKDKLYAWFYLGTPEEEMSSVCSFWVAISRRKRVYIALCLHTVLVKQLNKYSNSLQMAKSTHKWMTGKNTGANGYEYWQLMLIPENVDIVDVCNKVKYKYAYYK